MVLSNVIFVLVSCFILRYFFRFVVEGVFV